MFVLNAVLACARYVIGFVLVLVAATALNVGIVLGWNSLSPDSFSHTVSLAVKAVDTVADSGDVQVSALGDAARAASGGDVPLRQASNRGTGLAAPQ